MHHLLCKSIFILTTLLTLIPTALTTTPTASFNPSTCARQSIAACPTPYDRCCAYLCAEAQVPFDVCSPENETYLAQCSPCPSPTTTSKPSCSKDHPTTKPPSSSPSSPSSSIHKSTTTATPTKSSKHSSLPSPKPTASTFSTSTCTGRLLTTTACPTPYDPCCAWNCEEAQVPYNVCSPTDASGEFAVCSPCAKA